MLDILVNHGRNLLIGRFPSGPLGGLAMTLLLSVLCLALTFPAATLMALARTSGIDWLQRLCVGFLYAVRGMPLLMLVFWLYYFLPYVLGFTISPFVTMLIAITVFQTAYLSEVIRAAIEALPRGQFEAAQAIGLSYFGRTAYIVLPQALANCIPGIVSQFILIIKETSLGYIITFNELTYVATELNNILLVKPVQIFAILAASYFILCSSLSHFSAWLERRIETRRKAPQHA
ncbi:MAG TPA: amino acid ABC transporter permease [Ramlibacter sp.]|nr:amino acid ABC transporter permease [Ramlibacter sp.]